MTARDRASRPRTPARRSIPLQPVRHANARARSPRSSREAPSCARCGSNVRFRAIAHLVTQEAAGRRCALADLRCARTIVAASACRTPTLCARRSRAVRLREHVLPHRAAPRHRRRAAERRRSALRLRHRERRVRARARRRWRARSSMRARLLKPGGMLIFTVPFTLERDTSSTFPTCTTGASRSATARWRLAQPHADGRAQTLRRSRVPRRPGHARSRCALFSRAALEREFAARGLRARAHRRRAVPAASASTGPTRARCRWWRMPDEPDRRCRAHADSPRPRVHLAPDQGQHRRHRQRHRRAHRHSAYNTYRNERTETTATRASPRSRR